MWTFLVEADFQAWLESYTGDLHYQSWDLYETWSDFAVAPKWPHNVIARKMQDGTCEILSSVYSG